MFTQFSHHHQPLALTISNVYRGTAGFDLSGRGYYFANQSPSLYQPERQPQYPPPQFYEQAHKPLSYPDYLNNIPPHQYSPHTTPLIPPEFYQGKPALSPSSPSSTSSHTQTVSSGTIGIGVDSGGGSGSSSNNNNNKNNELDNKDKVR